MWGCISSEKGIRVLLCNVEGMKKPTKKELLSKYDELTRELCDIEWEIEEITTELYDRFEIDVYKLTDID